jgi:hypothetical protein
MENFIINRINQKLSEGHITLTEFLVDYMYVEGYVSDADYENYIRDNVRPKFTTTVFDNTVDDIQDKVRREEVVENKDSLRRVDLNMFE